MNAHLIDNRQIRVFISSTFQDMQDERDYLMKHTFPILRKLASERDVTLTELDLRWGITEEEAKSGKVVEICLREIENSIPFFIGIIGNRYGWVPEKKDLSENVTERFTAVNNYLERHLSVTEMEMQFGVLQRKEDMHAYFYIKEGEESSKADNPEMLERLKKEVQASRYPSTTYSSPEDLGIQVQQAFTTLLDQLFPEGHLSELEKERIGQRSFLNQLCQNYIRDDKNFQVLDEWMQDWDRHQMVVTGASGLGKSALIANWLKENLSDEHRDYNIIYHFTGNGGSESHHEHIMKVLSDEINDVYGWEEEEKEESNKSQKDKLNDLFLKVASEGKKPLLIVLDAINQIIDTDNAKLLNWLPIPPRNIKILFSTLEDDRTMEVFRNRHYPEFVLQPLDAEKRRQLATGYLWLYRKKLTETQIERIVTDKQSENTLVLKTLLDELINYGVFEKLDERIDYYLLPDTIEDFYQALLQSYEEDFGKDFVKQILSLIAVSRNGLSEDEILAITNYKQLHWSQFYCAFASHLNAKNGLISFSHRYVHNAVWSRYHLDDFDSAKPYRESVISYFNTNEFSDRNRQISELAFQYYHTDDLENLYKTILSFEAFSMFNATSEGDALLALYWRKLLKAEPEKYQLRNYLDLPSEGIDLENLPCLDIGSFVSDYLADYQTSLEYAQTYLQKAQLLGTVDSLEIAKSYNSIGGVYINKGDYDKALEYYLKALAVRENVLGTEHPNTAGTYNNIGLVYYYKDNYDKALEYYLKALAVWEKMLGTENSCTAWSYGNIGIVYSLKDDYDKALEYHLKALAIQEEVLGTGHLDTARSYINICSVYGNKGDYDKVLEYSLKALAVREKVLGTEHPDTARSYGCIGIVYKDEGDYDKALEYHLKALAIQEKVLGTEHPDTADSYSSIGIVFHYKGDYEKASEYYFKALAINEKVLGKDHSNTADSFTCVGTVNKDKGDYDKALEYYLKALAIKEKVLGKDHSNTADSYNDIGNVYYRKGNFDKALEYYLKALDINEKVFGLEHPDTARNYGNIGNVYSDKGDYGKALEYHLKALAIEEKVFGTEHPNTADSYYNIGTVYADKGDYGKALEYHLKALAIEEKVFGTEHPDTASSYDNIGIVYKDEGDYDKALEYYLKALAIREKVLGPEHPDTILSFFNIGNVYSYKGDSEKALVYYLKVFVIEKKAHGMAHPSIARVSNNIAWALCVLGRYEKALSWAKKAVAGLPENTNHLDTLATVYQGLGGNQEALEQFELCLKLKKEQNASEESIHETEEKIAKLKEQMN